MSYFKPYVDASGYHYPTYNDILQQLVDDMQKIYGTGIYLGTDSQDYEMLSEIAEKIYDAYQAYEIAYNSHSPIKSIGTGLDYIVAINGLKRKQATRSTVELDLTGTPYTIIAGGAVSDDAGNMWDLPATVTLDSNGTASATATCREAGIIYAAENTVTHIMTPMAGWEAVTNPIGASTGSVAEKDSELRSRQAQSVALPTRTLVEGLKAALGALDGVNRFAVHENDTNVTDGDGVPGHSICAIVEGGDNDEIAKTIFKRKAPGCGTYGSETVKIYDRYNQAFNIRFTRLKYVYVDIEIHITRRDGYTHIMIVEMKNAIIKYLDQFSIGTDLTTSIIWMVAQSVNADPRMPTFSISSVKAARHGATVELTDVIINYDEVVRGREPNISIIVDV